MSFDINNYLRVGKSLDRQTLNKILEALQNLNEEVEQDALKEKIAFAPEVRERLISKKTGVDQKLSEVKDIDDFQFTLTPGTKTAYPVTNATTGTIEMLKTGLKYGAGATFDGSSYITIPHNSAFDIDEGSFGMIFWFKSTTTGGCIYSKSSISSADYQAKDFNDDYNKLAEAEAGLEVIIDPQQTDNYNSTDYLADDHSTTTVNNGIFVQLEDGVDTISLNQLTSTNMFDGQWHSICVNSRILLPDYHADDYHADDYETVESGSELVEIFLDKVSIGSTSSSAVADMSNIANCKIGADKSNERFLIASIAHWFLESQPLTSAEITDFHDKGRMTTKNQINAIQFIGNEGTSVNNEVY